MYALRWIKTSTLLKGPDWSIFGIGQRVLSPDNAFKTKMKSPRAWTVIIIMKPRTETEKKRANNQDLSGKCNFH